MSNRLNQEREKKLEPLRIKTALDSISAITKIERVTEKEIQFLWQDELVTYWPYSGWHSGKSIKSGRGLNNLLKQLK